MYTSTQVDYAASLVSHMMAARKTSLAFKSLYPAGWNGDVSHFAMQFGEVAGLQGVEKARFVEEVKAKVKPQ